MHQQLVHIFPTAWFSISSILSSSCTVDCDFETPKTIILLCRSSPAVFEYATPVDKDNGLPKAVAVAAFIFYTEAYNAVVHFSQTLTNLFLYILDFIWFDTSTDTVQAGIAGGSCNKSLASQYSFGNAQQASSFSISSRMSSRSASACD